MKTLMYPLLFLLLLQPFQAIWADDCSPPAVVILQEDDFSGAHGFLSLTADQAVAFMAAINFTGPSTLSGGMSSGGTSLTVPAAGNYLISFSIASSGSSASPSTESNFGVFINGAALGAGTMDNTFGTIAPTILGTPLSLSLIASLAAGDVVDVRNISISTSSQSLTATNPAVVASPATRACLTVVRLS